ncbi:MAG: tRNA (N6-isopentenyl adenosine(37)-C2)-methylthiotransferase MiaB [Phycisphaerae bacterium]|nr:tRNA (N6-isopentenyl adenosine(37)-C2)-methylthiotransferase MiaB [Phycisphaerae bacterium]
MADINSGHTVFLETFGCQMNVLDSELVLGDLRAAGYAPAHRPDHADVILINTCSVRQRAEAKVLSRLGELKWLKQRRPELIIGVMGCMAERDAEGILEQAPHVDVICGPGELGRIRQLIEQARGNGKAAVAVTRDQMRRVPVARRATNDGLEALDRSRRPAREGPLIQAYIRVQRGCDKFCSYCVVPFVRGPERSRPPAHIVDEAKRLADAGTVEITLLGQTVNSYAYEQDGRIIRLPALLERVHEIDGVRRLRFVTSFPGDFDEAILHAMRDLPKVCEYLHLPVQSGSDRILRSMRRGGTVGQYDELIDRARDIVPGLTLAGDFIVGFPGETEGDFQATCDLVRRTRYKNIFVFKYSPRPGTLAARKIADDVPMVVKRRRNHELLAIQSEISSDQNAALVGSLVEVLVEGYSKAAIKAQKMNQSQPTHLGWRSQTQLTGRTRGDQIVVFEGSPDLIGQLATIEVISTTDLTLHGRLAEAV